MKKKFLIIAMILAVILSSLIIINYFSPRPIIYETTTAHLGFLKYNSSDSNVILTAEQEKQLLFVLSKYRCRRTLKDYFPYFATDVKYEIYLRTETENPWHILVGNINICYIAGNHLPYEIIDPQSLIHEIDDIFTTQ